jgi:hypothetical protein
VKFGQLRKSVKNGFGINRALSFGKKKNSYPGAYITSKAVPVFLDSD